MLSASADATGEGLSPGTVLGKYRVQARLGEGAMGVVFSAVHERLGRPVAIKVLRKELSDNTELSGRFQMEAELVTRIGHPNIVAVYDFGRLADGSLYYVMEKIQGESLRDRMERGNLDDAEIVQVFAPLLSALRAAHEIGVVHRDLKPENVMLTKGADGTSSSVKLLDFGIAKIRDERPAGVQIQAALDHKDSLATAAGAIMGTPAYMSPEQIQNSSSVDKRSDVYALGIMLYEVLAGDRPFIAATSAELMGQHLYKVAEPPSKLAQKNQVTRRIPWSKVDAVVLRAMAKKSTDRYQDCASLQSELETAWGQSFALVRGGALTGGSSATVPALSGAALAQGPKKSRRMLALAAGLVASLAIAGGVYLLAMRRVDKPVVSAPRNERAEALFAAAQAGEPAQRRMLMEIIEAVGGRDHLPAIAHALADEDTGVWWAALHAVILLAQPGDTLFAEPLAALATQAVGALSVDVAAARMRIAEPEAEGVLTSTLQSPLATPESRLRAAVVLARADKLPAATLRQVLESTLRAGAPPPPRLRRAALVRLAVARDAEALRQLKETVEAGTPKGTPSNKVTLMDEALEVLTLAQRPHASDHLNRAAESAQGERRLELASVLAEAGDARASKLLLPLLKSADAKTRAHALSALGRLAKEGHFPAYLREVPPMLSDPDPQVALTAAVTLLDKSPPAPGSTGDLGQ